MARPKKNTSASAPVNAPAKTRKPRTTDPDERIALVDAQIQRLEKLNAERRELIAQTEAKLNQRKEALLRSEEALANAQAKRDRIIQKKAMASMTREQKAAIRAEEKAKLDELMEALKLKGKTLDDILAGLKDTQEEA